MKFNYYDIESLQNLFTLCNYKEDEEEVEIYYLLDDKSLLDETFKEKLIEEVYRKNQNFKGKISIYDLLNYDNMLYMGTVFGITRKNSFYEDKAYKYRLTSDFENDFDENIHPYFVGYNSKNYDTTMLAEFFEEALFSKCDGLNHFSPKMFKDKLPKAKALRDFNNLLFNNDEIRSYMPKALMYVYHDIDPTYSIEYQPKDWNDRRNILRNAWIRSGRYLDVSNFNEQQSRVGLKKILGILGYQILESNKLKDGQDIVKSQDEIIEILAYNVSDVVNLKYLMHHDSYMSTFNLKKNLLKTYPSLMYEKKEDSYEADIKPEKIRSNRMTPDDTSSKLASYIVCPYDRLKDIETVSLNYPSDKAMEIIEKENQKLPEDKRIHVNQINVLEFVKDFFFENIKDEKARDDFLKIYKYYKRFEGSNFNDSKEYYEDYPKGPAPIKESSIKAGDLIIPYYKKDGTPTSCYVNFSIGGIHGAEYNKEKLEKDLKDYKKQCDLIDEVKEKYENVLDFRNLKRVTLSDGKEYECQKFLKSGTTIKKLKTHDNEYNKKHFLKSYPSKPTLTQKRGDSYVIKDKYLYTSIGHVIHQDFSSYYPNLLRVLKAFWNEALGEDIYGKIYEKKEEYGKKRKDERYSESERIIFNILREGVKLILNSVTGKADSNFYSPIRMNNMIITMRITGQLFTYYVAQSQALDGTKIVSTNTDGLYAKVSDIIDLDENYKKNHLLKEEKSKELEDILKEVSKPIQVLIEPEKMFLLSKDSNNRLELNDKKSEILSAGGGELACFKDTNPKKALDHPAIIDYALSEYLFCIAHKYKDLSIDKPLDKDIARNIFIKAKNRFSPNHLLRMYQNIISSTDVAYIFAYDNENHTEDDPYILGKYNRVFYVKDDTPNSLFLKIAETRKISDRDLAKRRKNKEPELCDDPKALKILEKYNVDRNNMIKENREAQFKKVSKIGLNWHVLIENRSINHFTENEALDLLDKLELDHYIELLENTYNNNWKNN